MKTKVFSRDKFIKEQGIDVYHEMTATDGVNWVDECNGLTEEEMNEKRYGTLPEWMVDKEEK